MKLNAIEVLYLHFVHGLTHEEAVMYDFWFTQYSSTAEDLIASLMEKEVIYKSNAFSITLKKLKVPELKRLLKHSGIKVSGNKSILIERIIDNQHIIDLKNEDLKSVYTVKNAYIPFLEETNFINYFHFNGHISVYEAYDYYIAHPEKSSEKIVAGVLNEKIENSIKKPNKYDALKSFQLLSHFFLEEMNDLKNSIYYLNNFTMLIILQSILNYPSYKMILPGNHFNVDNFTAYKYRKLLDTDKMTPYDLYHALVDDTVHLPYSYENRKKAARFIVAYVMDDENAEIKLKKLLDDY